MRALKSQYTAPTVFPYHLFCSPVKNADKSFWKDFLHILYRYLYIFKTMVLISQRPPFSRMKSASLRAWVLELWECDMCQTGLSWNLRLGQPLLWFIAWFKPLLSVQRQWGGISYSFCQSHFCMTSVSQRGSCAGSSPVVFPSSLGSECFCQVHSLQY